jgi:type I restriction enzyme R subunit
MLTSRQAYFENLEQVREVVREIVKELGCYTKVADWNRKEYLKAKIRMALKTVLMKAVDGRASYPDYEKLSVEVIDHAETVYVLQHDERLLAPNPTIGFANSIG